MRDPRSFDPDRYSSWGRNVIARPSRVRLVSSAEDIGRFDDADSSWLPYGLGRSYGDSCLNDGGGVFDMRPMNRVIAFDAGGGAIDCEAGVTFTQILQAIVPAGWFLPVVPGTQFVTVGGAIANDIHGKNHHVRGSLGCHVESLTLVRSNGARIECSQKENKEMFAATIGGLGLTGIITQARIRLKRIPSVNLAVETIPFKSLDDFLALSNDGGFEYTVAWFDSLSAKRGVFFRGNHCEGPLAPVAKPRFGLRVPFAAPGFLLSRASISAFNSMYFLSNKLKPSRSVTHFEPFFFPLDSIRDWNRLYGKRGFAQYQCVVPTHEVKSLREIMRLIANDGTGSFLGVLKTFGDQASPGLMSFPRKGITLALDFPWRGAQTETLFTALDRIVSTAGGALYPAKDSRMSPAMFHASFPRLREFRALTDPHLSSSFWRRVQ